MRSSAEPESPEEAERRAYPRARVVVSCDLEVEGKLHLGVLRDVSANGIFVEIDAPAPTPLPCGAEVEVWIRDFSAPPFWLRGRLVRDTEGRGVGVEIISAPEDFYWLLYALML